LSRVRTFAVDCDKWMSLPLINTLIEIFKPTSVVLSSRLVSATELFQEDGLNELMTRHYHPEVTPGQDEHGAYFSCNLYKAHFYWAVHNQFGSGPMHKETHLTEEEETLKNHFRMLQNSLAWRMDDEINYLIGTPESEDLHWTDKGLTPLSQTLRLPGFYHLKNFPEVFLTSVHFANSDGVYNPEELQELLNSLFLSPVEIQNDWLRFEQWKKTKSKKNFDAAPVLLQTSQGYTPVEGYPGAGQGDRNGSLHKYACYLFFTKAVDFDACLAICQQENHDKNLPPLDDSEVESIVESAWRYYEQKEKDKIQKKVAPELTQEQIAQKLKATIKDANVVGQMFGAAPASLLAAAQSLENNKSLAAAAATWTERLNSKQRISYDTTDTTDFADLLTDQSIAARVMQRYHEGLRLHPDGDLWIWDHEKGVWREDSAYVSQFVVTVGADIVNEPGVLRKFIKADGSGMDLGKLDRLKQSLHSEKRITSIIKILKRSRPIKVEAALWDGDSNLLNCQNGVLNIETGEIYPHAPEFLMTRRSRFVLKQSVEDEIETNYFMGKDLVPKHNRWTQFVWEIMQGDIDMYYYLQKITGYCLSGGNPFEALFFFHGHGANGKSIFTETFSHLLGDYSAPMPADVLLQDGPDKSKILAQMPGLRMSLTSELGGKRYWNEESIKNITGQDVIKVRPIYKQAFDYRPEFKTIVRGNTKPRLRATDYGIWRRLRIVPFDKIFYPKDRDIHLRGKLDKLNSEILAWAVAGARMLEAEGFAPPKRAQEVYIEYRKETMPVLNFISSVFDLPASGLSEGDLEAGVGPHIDESASASNGHDVSPTEIYKDCVDADKLYRLYIVWYGKGVNNRMTEQELWESCEALGLKKAQIPIVDKSALQPELKATWCFGLRVKPEWDKKSESGKFLFGHGVVEEKKKLVQ